ncbi:MAG: ADP-ribosylglycohydrolase family protein [Deltaproteobacteria bacterium]
MDHALPVDHEVRLSRARLALAGLSVGDAFGERFFVHPSHLDGLIAERALPHAPWRYTDDTEMALGIMDVLGDRGSIDQDALAGRFAARYLRDPQRGYGGGAHTILGEIARGESWRESAGRVFDGQGSMGNGGAMRVAPIGAYFADDLDAVVTQARASAEVTHAHEDGQAGAIAAALATAYAWRWRRGDADVRETPLIEWILGRVPPGRTREGLVAASAVSRETSPREAARRLGSGARVLSWDTVPFALWCAARHLDAYEEAMWTTVSGLGDRDTTCAIAGGIVALGAGPSSIPPAWLEAREPLR